MTKITSLPDGISGGSAPNRVAFRKMTAHIPARILKRIVCAGHVYICRSEADECDRVDLVKDHIRCPVDMRSAVIDRHCAKHSICTAGGCRHQTGSAGFFNRIVMACAAGNWGRHIRIAVQGAAPVRCDPLVTVHCSSLHIRRTGGQRELMAGIACAFRAAIIGQCTTFPSWGIRVRPVFIGCIGLISGIIV